MQDISRSYQVSNGGTFTDTIPVGYRSVTMQNNSGFYVLLRLGGYSIPGDAKSADKIIPPFHMAQVKLRGFYIAGYFSNIVSGLSSNLSSDYAGILSATYSTQDANETISPIGGSTQSVIQPLSPDFGKWVRSTFTANLDGLNPVQMALGPIYVREAFIRATAVIDQDAKVSLYIATQVNPFVPVTLLEFQNYFLASNGVIFYQPKLEYKAGLNAEILVNVSSGLYAYASKPLNDWIFSTEYRS